MPVEMWRILIQQRRKLLYRRVRHAQQGERPRAVADMTNRIALVLGILIVALFGADLLLFDGAGGVFLGKKFSELTEFIAFWR